MTLARDVAKELERRARRRKLLFLAAIVGLVILAILYVRCGAGWGLGGGGTGEGSGTGSASVNAGPDAAPRRCSVKVAVGGTTVDGVAATIPEAVAKCAAGADLLCTAGARQGDCDAMRAALEAAKIPTYVAR